MLNKIPKILPPDLVKIMMQMGHGDEMVIGDGNYPADSMGTRVVRLDGHNVPEVLDAVVNVLSDLTGGEQKRLVGIITHVEGLERQLGG